MAGFIFNFAPCLIAVPMPLVAHLWTISVEEQFYLVWPLILRMVPKRRMIVVPVAMFAIASIARLLSSIYHLDVAVWHNTFTRLDPIAVGILIAILPETNPRPAYRVGLTLIGLASWWFAAWYCGLPLEGSALQILIGYPAVALGSGAFLLAMLGTRSGGSGSRARRVMIYLGKISYGLYVYDAIAVIGAQMFMFRSGLWPLHAGGPLWTANLLYLTLTFSMNVVLAAASYRWLEAPFLRLKSRFTAISSRPV